VSRIAGRFEQLVAEGRKALIPYIVAGDPDTSVTVPLMHAMVEAGADIIELGVPFSDPMSEGPVIQLAHERALDKGASLRGVIDMVESFRRDDQETPVLLMGYANPVERMGYAAFADRASQAGVDALLTVDIPPEEVSGLNAELRRVAMDNIFLIAPTTPDERVGRIVSQASGFIYSVALKGVTGAANLDAADVGRQLERVRRETSLPIAVGFGIKDAESAAAVARVADGVVVGSALVDHLAQSGSSSAELAEAAYTLLSEMRRAIDGVSAS